MSLAGRTTYTAVTTAPYQVPAPTKPQPISPQAPEQPVDLDAMLNELASTRQPAADLLPAFNTAAQGATVAWQEDSGSPPLPGAAAPPAAVLAARQAVLEALLASDQATKASEEAQRLAYEAHNSTDDSFATASIRRVELKEAEHNAAEALGATKEDYHKLCEHHGLVPDSVSEVRTIRDSYDNAYTLTWSN